MYDQIATGINVPKISLLFNNKKKRLFWKGSCNMLDYIFLGWEYFMAVHTISLLMLCFCLPSKYHINLLGKPRAHSSSYIWMLGIILFTCNRYLQVRLFRYYIHLRICFIRLLCYFNVRVHVTYHQSTNKLDFLTEGGWFKQLGSLWSNYNYE